MKLALEGKNTRTIAKIAHVSLKDIGTIIRKYNGDVKEYQTKPPSITSKAFHMFKEDYRREIIISFPNKFEGKDEDPFLLDKLASKEELSAIFNILMNALRVIIRNKRLYLNEKTIEERRLKHDRAVNPVKAFVDEAISEDSKDLDYVVKADLYSAFRKYIKDHSLASKSPEAFGKMLKSMGWQQCRKTIGDERYNCWIGRKLKSKFICVSQQQQVTVWT